MKRTTIAAFATLASLAAGSAFAAQPLQFNADVYPMAQLRARDAAQAAQAVTREQVRAELDAARRTGDLMVGDVGLKQNQIDPAHYAGATAQTAKTADQVRADRAEARRGAGLPAGALRNVYAG
jgi:hypothetical protein